MILQCRPSIGRILCESVFSIDTRLLLAPISFVERVLHQREMAPRRKQTSGAL